MYAVAYYMSYVVQGDIDGYDLVFVGENEAPQVLAALFTPSPYLVPPSPPRSVQSRLERWPPKDPPPAAPP